MTARKPKSEHKKAGRPTVFTEHIIGKIEEIAALDGTIEEMASFADINKNTLYSYIQDHPEFSQRIQHLREWPVLVARRSVVNSLKDPDRAFRYLERKKKDEFSQRTESQGTMIHEIRQITGMKIIKENETPNLPEHDARTSEAT